MLDGEFQLRENVSDQRQRAKATAAPEDADADADVDAEAEAEAEAHEKADDGFELVLCTQFSVADYQELQLALALTSDPNVTVTLVFTLTLTLILTLTLTMADNHRSFCATRCRSSGSRRSRRSPPQCACTTATTRPTLRSRWEARCAGPSSTRSAQPRLDR